jgi:hypothetical protein
MLAMGQWTERPTSRQISFALRQSKSKLVAEHGTHPASQLTPFTARSRFLGGRASRSFDYQLEVVPVDLDLT